MPQSNRQAPQYAPGSALQPVASPVQVARYAPASNPMLDLARGLRELNPALDQYIGQQAEELDAKDFQQGQLAYMKAKSNLKDAVDKGTIEPGYSPAFRRGYQQGQLRVAGLDYDQQLRTAYATSAAANSDDPHALQNFVQDFTSKYIDQKGIGKDFHPLDVAQAFMPAIDQSQRSLSAYHTEQRAKTIEDDWQANAQSEISTIIDNGRANKFTPEQLGAAVNTAMAKQMENGWHDKSTFNQHVVDLVTAKAIENRDSSLLGTLQHIPTGPGSSLGNTTYARGKALEASQHISNLNRADVQWDWAQKDHVYQQQAHAWAQQEHAHTMQDWAIEKNAGTLMRAMIAQTVIDPTQDFSQQVLQLSKMDRDGSHARAFLAFHNTQLESNSEGVDHPDAVTDLYQSMVTNPQTLDPSVIVKAYTDKKISKKTMTGMLDDQRRFAQEGQNPLMQTPVFKSLDNGVMAAFRGDPDSFDVDKVNATTAAIVDFRRHTMNYIAAHKLKGDLNEKDFLDNAQWYHDKLVKPLLEAAKPAPKKGAAQQPNPFNQSGMAHH